MFTIQINVENDCNDTWLCILINLPLGCKILLFADLHEFGGKPVGLKRKGSLGCLYRVWNDRREAFHFAERFTSKDLYWLWLIYAMEKSLTSATLDKLIRRIISLQCRREKAFADNGFSPNQLLDLKALHMQGYLPI